MLKLNLVHYAIKIIATVTILVSLLFMTNGCTDNAIKSEILNSRLENGYPIAYEVEDAFDLPLYMKDVLISDDSSVVRMGLDIFDDSHTISHQTLCYLYDRHLDIYRLKVVVIDSITITYLGRDSEYDTTYTVNNVIPYIW